MVILVIAFAALAALVMDLAGIAINGFALDEIPAIGPASAMAWVCAITLIAVASMIGCRTLVSRFATLTVTDDRTIYREGIVSRETSEVQHDDVRNIQLDQSFLQRLLNVGEIGFSSSGQDDLEVVAKRLPHQERIIRLIRENQQ